MAIRRILLIDKEGPQRDALARVIRSEGHEVRVANAADHLELLNEFAPDTVLYREAQALGQQMDARLLALPKPVNMEELRRALRED